MRVTLKTILLLYFSLTLSACVTGKYGTNYISYVDPEKNKNSRLLLDGEEPTIIGSQNIEQDKTKYLNMDFIIIGEANFKSYEEPKYFKLNLGVDEKKVLRQAIKVRATHILYFRKRVDENVYVNYDRASGEYKAEHQNVFENHTVYLVRKQ